MDCKTVIEADENLGHSGAFDSLCQNNKQWEQTEQSIGNIDVYNDDKIIEHKTIKVTQRNVRN